MAGRLGIAGRVHFAPHGELDAMVRAARGMVTVNSTVATSAFDHDCPTKALGRAIYNFEGLTAQASLDEFWHNPPAPDPKVNRAFRATLLERCLVHGSFYSTKGVTLAVRHAADLLHHRSGTGAGSPIKPDS
jgi:capsular polysaccharide export protein